jgi:cobalamin biosynthetic protein CobC
MTGRREETVVHGGNIDAARRQFPDAPQPWIDLSTGINPDAYPLPPLEPEAWARLPQPSAEAALLRAAAHRYGTADAGMVVAGAGTQAILQVLPRLVASTRVAVLGPTYAEHALAWRHQDHEVVEIEDLAAIGPSRVVVVVNPNNPTGHIVPAAELRALAQDLAMRGGLLVVDEAFADFVPTEVSLIPDLPPATVVLRSFGKAYGLAGMRLGFAVAHEPMASKLRDALGPWAVSGPALAIGARALDDELWLARTRKALEMSGARLDQLLAGAGFDIIGATPLFRLTSYTHAAQMAHALGRRGILVRRFVEHPTWLRFGIPGSDGAWLRLEDALAIAGRERA